MDEADQCYSKLDIKTEQLEEYEKLKLEDLHHSIDIKDEPSFPEETEPEEEARKLKCGVCDVKFNNALELRNHEVIHNADTKLYECAICMTYKSTSKRNFVRHLSIHRGKKRFVCGICDYKSTDKGTLRRHVMIHAVDKPYRCSICEYKCSRKEYLRKHVIASHTDEKPFVCKLCGYRTSVKEILRIHLRTHTSEKPFACKICENKYTQEAYLQAHLKTHRIMWDFTEKPIWEVGSLCMYIFNTK